MIYSGIANTTQAGASLAASLCALAILVPYLKFKHKCYGATKAQYIFNCRIQKNSFIFFINFIFPVVKFKLLPHIIHIPLQAECKPCFPVIAVINNGFKIAERL